MILKVMKLKNVFLIIIAVFLIFSCAERKSLIKEDVKIIEHPAEYSVKYPEWFYNSYYKGYFGAVGSAKKQTKGGFTAQRRLAKLIAEGELVKQKKILIDNVCMFEKEIIISDDVIKNYKTKIDCESRQTASGFIKNAIIKAEWIHPKTAVLYVWMVVEK